MSEFIDVIGQWLIQLPVIWQTVVLLAAVLIPGGAAAFALIGAIDVVVGRVFGRWGRRHTGRDRARIELARQ
ncbi:hypothetical protein KRX51_07525 [Corynebacterium sp. TAE3-ERU12]|uniref:hypothetical protein n=1 Tax=Corynebacterium sp. TAE3-ERU12 TaxID=2849491 RepID=UPI001C494B8B|nr:hypothetical protein [Corynebacterium sp. TAE3-ERU12]MBV7295763.1 hypothetical protein [Corynebacterium sp. TAE3-ERU12]